jgi:hypothetical protein
MGGGGIAISNARAWCYLQAELMKFYDCCKSPQNIANSPQFAAIRRNSPQFAAICRNSPQFAAICCKTPQLIAKRLRRFFRLNSLSAMDGRDRPLLN